MNLQPRGAWQNKLVNWLLFYAAFCLLQGRRKLKEIKKCIRWADNKHRKEERQKVIYFYQFQLNNFSHSHIFCDSPTLGPNPKKEDTKARKLLNKLAEFDEMECRGSATLWLVDVRHCAERFVMFHDIRLMIKTTDEGFAFWLFQSEFLCDVISRRRRKVEFRWMEIFFLMTHRRLGGVTTG